MFLFLLLLLLLTASAFALLKMLRLPQRALRWLMGVAFAAAQLVLTIQLLSLVRRLGEYELLLANLACTALLGAIWYGVDRRRGPAPPVEPPPEPPLAWGWFEWCTVVVLGGGLLLMMVCGAAVFNATDPYHFSMTLFWRQNHTILPFVVHDPRVIGTTFATEAMALPGVLYANTGLIFVVLAAFAAGLCLALIHEITRLLGFSTKAAFLAVAVMAGCELLAGSIFAAKAELLFSVLWLLGSIYCLLLAHQEAGRVTLLLGFSALCFALGCGSKNVILFHGPAYLVAFLCLFGKSCFWPRRWGTMLAFGFVGALVSGMLWTYLQNYFWFGSFRGHPFLQETLAQDFDVASIWTRLCRNVVLIAYDPGWVPPRVQDGFARVTLGTIEALGGQQRLAEDSGFYSLELKDLRGRMGVGPTGPLIWIPGLILAIRISIRRQEANVSRQRFQALCLFSVLSFLTFFVLLRTQRIGTARLMGSCFAASLPLCALLLEKRWVRWPLLAGLAAVFAINFAPSAAYTIRRVDFWPGSKVRNLLASLARSKPQDIPVSWNGGPVESLAVRESYTTRELFLAAYTRIPAGAPVALIGGYNAEGIHCFGPDFTHRVTVLQDCRPSEMLNPPPDVEFIFVEDFDIAQIPPRVLENFSPFFTADLPGKAPFACYRRVKAGG